MSVKQALLPCRANSHNGHCQYLTRKQVLQRLRSSNIIIESIAKKYGVLSIIPVRKLCLEEQEYCNIFDADQKLLYRDDDHLNNYGSRYLINLFAKEITEFLALDSTHSGVMQLQSGKWRAIQENRPAE